MVVKIVALGVVVYLIYILFFRAKRGSVGGNNSPKKDSETMVECQQCTTFISAKEALIKDGKYYCSKECLKAAR